MADVTTVDVVFSRERLAELLLHVGRAITGTEPDTHEFAERFWSAFTHSMFTSIFDAFLKKRDGGTDELGNKWEDLLPKTKAYSRPDARKGLSLTGPKNRPTLTKEQDRIWRGRFFGIYKKLAVHMSEAEAKRIASAAAWEYVKKQLGAETLLGLLKSKALPLLHRTGVLQASLFPAPLSDGSYLPIDPNQVYRREAGVLTLGTKVEYAVSVDKKRPLWPASMPLWLSRAVEAGRDAVYEHLPTVLEQME